MAKVTYKVPLFNKKGERTIEERTGDVVWTEVDGKRIKCVLQKHEGKVALVHYATGARIISETSIAARQLRYACNRITAPARAVALELLTETLEHVGTQKLFDQIAAQPVLNP